MINNKPYEVKETWTNLFYMLASFASLHYHNDYLFAVCMMILSVSSYYWHRTKTHQLFDWYAMVLVLLVVSAQLIQDDLYKYVTLIYLFLYGYFIMGKINVYVEVAFASVFAIVSSIMYRGFGDTFYLILWFSFCLFVRAKDVNPNQDKFHDSWFHSIWHLISAVGLYALRYL